MAGNAPAFTWQTGHPAIAVPNDPLDTVVAVADRYGATLPGTGQRATPDHRRSLCTPAPEPAPVVLILATG